MGFERIWHASYAAGVPPAIDPERVTMAEALRRTAGRFPDRTAFNYLGRKISFGQLEALVNRFTRALAALGVREGDNVAMLMPNIPQHVIANHACYRLGAVTVMNDPLYTEQELETQIKDSGARFLITLDLLLPRALEIRAATKVETIVPCHINDFLPFPTRQLIPFLQPRLHLKIPPGPGIHPFLDIIGKESNDPVPIAARWEERAAVIYTDGTTGPGKGVVLTHENLSAAVQQLRAWFPGLREGEESLMGVYPIFRADGYAISQNLTIWAGWTNIMVPRPEPLVVLDLLKKHRPGLFPGIPSLFAGLLKLEAFRKMDLSFIKGFINGSERLAAETAERFQKRTGKGIIDLYGLTESSATATGTPWNGKARQGTAGVPLPSTDLRIVDLKSGLQELPAGEAGEICLKGPQIMQGYLNRPEETAGALRGGWLHTGDIGFLDREGHLSVLGRKGDRIATAGGDLSLWEVDDLLLGHPMILEACTLFVPDENGEGRIKAFVVIKPGESLTEAEVIEYCRRHLTADSVPRQVAFPDALPRNDMGKIIRRELAKPEATKEG